MATRSMQASKKSVAARPTLPSNRKGNRKNSRRARSALTPIGGAPVAISRDLQQFTRFSRGSAEDSITMHTCAAISQILRATSNSVGTAILSPGANTGVSLQLNLTQPASLSQTGTKVNVNYTSPIFDLIASAFVRYRVKKLIFHYEPQSSATTTERLVFAFADDPMHPILWNATPPDQNGLLALSDSVAFAPWRSWSMDVSHRIRDQLFYTFTDPSTSVASFAERFSDFGVLSCVTDTVSAGVNPACGILYMESVVELIEFCPISLSAPVSSFLARKVKQEEKPSYRPPMSETSSDRDVSKLGL